MYLSPMHNLYMQSLPTNLANANGASFIESAKLYNFFLSAGDEFVAIAALPQAMHYVERKRWHALDSSYHDVETTAVPTFVWSKTNELYNRPSFADLSIPVW